MRLFVTFECNIELERELTVSMRWASAFHVHEEVCMGCGMLGSVGCGVHAVSGFVVYVCAVYCVLCVPMPISSLFLCMCVCVCVCVCVCMSISVFVSVSVSVSVSLYPWLCLCLAVFVSLDLFQPLNVRGKTWLVNTIPLNLIKQALRQVSLRHASTVNSSKQRNGTNVYSFLQLHIFGGSRGSKYDARVQENRVTSNQSLITKE